MRRKNFEFLNIFSTIIQNERYNEVESRLWDLLHQVMVVPLLPADDIKDAFTMVLNNMSDVITQQEVATCDVFRRVFGNVKIFCTYVQNYWMRPNMKNELSCFMQEKRTNNSQESWHKMLKIYIRSKNPYIAEFMGKFCVN